LPVNKKIRLDDFLVEQGYFASRDEVLRATIERTIRVNDVYVTSAAIKINQDVDIFIKGKKQYVSRGGIKLQGALDTFDIKVEWLDCIDIGSSTGGFSDCLLQAGAKSVTCVDVNYGQLSWKIRNDARVKVFERTNIRLANPADIGAPFDVVVADLSFIGLSGLAQTFSNYCKPGGTFVGLIKPQFEAYADENECGIVTNPEVRKRVVEEVSSSLANSGFEIKGICESPIKGTEGNIEYLVYALKLDTLN
jgi:23S rRNA (cytidine1920-2'-O)/16S rRNA (cytidine1409-2'-O)-methyltransferase